ncbi:unnamed protein product [Phytomonas sp. EM1]|nr:unnamed protein product [Phytomonas sp. EM1]|eukprot:CCW59846.1 unnamed protein product [Phytomonas sp. isolate EM1]
MEGNEGWYLHTAHLKRRVNRGKGVGPPIRHSLRRNLCSVDSAEVHTPSTIKRIVNRARDIGAVHRAGGDAKFPHNFLGLRDPIGGDVRNSLVQ